MLIQTKERCHSSFFVENLSYGRLAATRSEINCTLNETVACLSIKSAHELRKKNYEAINAKLPLKDTHLGGGAGGGGRANVAPVRPKRTWREGMASWCTFHYEIYVRKGEFEFVTLHAAFWRRGRSKEDANYARLRTAGGYILVGQLSVCITPPLHPRSICHLRSPLHFISSNLTFRQGDLKPLTPPRCCISPLLVCP